MLLVLFLFLIFYLFILSKREVGIYSIWIFYISLETIVSYIGYSIFKENISYVLIMNPKFFYVFFVSITCIIFSYSFFRKRKHRSNNNCISFNAPNYFVSIFVLFSIFFAISIKLFYFNVNDLSSNNIRGIIVKNTSGFEFLLYKLGLIIIGLFAFKSYSSKLSFIEKFTFVIILFFYSLYGGRYLIFISLFIYIIIARFDTIISFSKLKLLLFILVFYVISLSYAHIRYYSSYEADIVNSLTLEKISATALWQLGGNLVDFSLAASELKEKQFKENFFPTILEGFLPNSVRETFFQSYFSKQINYGKSFAESIGQENNGLRLNFTNEVYFSFGFFGVIIYSMLIGYLLSYFDAFQTITQRCIAVFFISQILSLHILGTNTLSNSFFLTVLYSLSVKFNSSKNHGVINNSQL